MLFFGAFYSLAPYKCLNTVVAYEIEHVVHVVYRNDILQFNHYSSVIQFIFYLIYFNFYFIWWYLNTNW